MVYFVGGYVRGFLKLFYIFKWFYVCGKSLSYVCGGVYIRGKIGLHLWALERVLKHYLHRVMCSEKMNKIN